MRWRLQPSEGRLTLSPWRADAVRGDVPVYGWSTDRADQLRLQVDHEDVTDWAALARLRHAGLSRPTDRRRATGARFRDGVKVRGHDIVLDHGVNGSRTGRSPWTASS